MDTTPPVTTSYEPCTTFVAHDDTPVCTTCGWLDREHVEPREVDVVREERAAA
jgi:hypothetical protein